MTAQQEPEGVDKLIRPILRKLNSITTDIEASAVMTRDGLSIASIMGAGVDPDRLGAMCASMLSLADKTAKELERGKLKQVLVDGEAGYMLLVHVGANAVLAVVSRPDVHLGKVLLEAKKTAAEISKII